MDTPSLARHVPEGMPPLRVLCVDDNRDVADSEAELLHLVGFETETCYDGESALREARRFLPSVCLIDLNMPGMDGDELAVRLRATADWHPLLLVAVTAMDSADARRRVESAGFDLHMVKPVDPYKLVAVVDALYRLGSSRMVAGAAGRSSRSA